MEAAQQEPEPPLGLAVLMFISYRAMETQILDALREAGHPLTVAQARVAARINAEGSRLTELAAAAQTTKQNAGFVVGQLLDQGIVERVPDPTDARAKLIRITPFGDRVRQVARAAESRVEAEWVATLGERSASELRSALEKLRDVTDPYRPQIRGA